MVTFMKMSIEFATELINVYVSYTVTYDEVWVVMCFSAMCLINQIDEQYYLVLEDDKIKEKLECQFQYTLPVLRECNGSNYSLLVGGKRKKDKVDDDDELEIEAQNQ